MQALHVTIMSMLLALVPLVSAAAAPVISLKSEYRHDALDYGSETSWFFRQKATFSHGNTTAGAAITRKSKTGKCSITGCAIFSPPGTAWKVTAGNFYTSFGAGLLIGKGNSFNPDPFSARPVHSPERVFTPCLSGNPEYAFQGMGLSMCTPGNRRLLDLNTFYSVQERYTTGEYIESGSTPQSVNSLLSRTRKEDRYNQPVTLRTAGASLTCRPGRYLLLQVNCYTSKLVHDNHETLEWNREENEFYSRSMHMLRGSGYYACYHDEFVTAFVEQCWCFNRISESGQRGTRRATGIVTGTRYRNPFMEMRAMYKKTDPLYEAPFGNSLGSSSPEEVFSLRLQVEPFGKLETGISFENENSLAPSSYYCEYSHARKYSVFLGYRQKMMRLHAEYAGCEVYRGGLERYYTRQKMKYALFPDGRISVDGNTILQQRKSSGYSWCTGVQLGYNRWMNLRAEAGLLWFSARGSNPLYASLLQLPGTSIPFMYMAGKAMLGAARIKFSRAFLDSWIRVLYPLYREEADMSGVIEFALSMEF